MEVYMFRRTTGVLLAIALGFAPAASAQPRPITLEEAVGLAKRNALQVIQARGQARTSAAGVRAAYAAFLPNVTLTAGATRQFVSGARTRIDNNGQVITLPSDPWSSSAGFGANVDLFTGGQRFFALRQARATQMAAEVNETAQQYDAALAAKQEFFNVLAARESQGAAAAQLEQAEQQRKTAIARTQARVATRSDSLRAEIQYRAAQLAVTDARNALESANASLTRVVGSEQPVTAMPVDSLEHPGLALDEGSLRPLAENGPAVRQAKAGLDAAKAAQGGAWTDYLPSLTASYSRTGSGTGDAPVLAGDNFGYSGALRFSASLPLFNQWQREERVTQAKVAQENAEAALRDTRLAAVETLTQQLGAFHSAEERVVSQAASVAAAEEDLRVQQQRYAVGGSTILDVLTSQTQLNGARSDLIRARYDQRVAKAQLEALVGREL
jgi:outer membrane protein